MGDHELLSREELLSRLQEAEAALEALRSGQADTIIGATEPLVVKPQSAERQLKESEGRLRFLFENLRQGVIFQDAVGHRVTWCNQAAEEILGLSLEEMRSHPARAADWSGIRQGGSELPQSEHPALEALRSCQAVRDVLVGVINAKEGMQRWIQVDTVPLIRSGEEHPYQVATFFNDITERKRAEDEKLALEAQLRHAQKMQAVGTLAGGIAHEFNNLLGIVMGFAELAKDLAQHRQDNSSEVEQIIKAADRASVLVRQMLTFSRKMGTNKKPLHLNNSVIHTAKMLELTIPRTISIETNLDPDLPPVEGDNSQLEQVLINLGTNARDAMPEGGKLGISTELVTLQETAVCDACGGKFSGAHVLLTVTDTGEGMDQRTKEQMYEPFFSTKGVGKGTGLGLSVVLGLVKDHGGHINCESTPGVGTAFMVYLPVLHGGADVGHDDQPLSEQGQGGSETVLLVDDEESLRSLGERYMGSVGYQVITAGSGEEAMDICRTRGGEIALVVLDLGMPGMGGHKALKEILTINPQAKVIIASGYTSDAQVKDSLEAGAAAFVAKPYKREDLLATVHKVLHP